MAKDYRTEGQNVTKSRLIQAIIMNLFPGLFFTYRLITCAVFCFKLSFVVNSLHCLFMLVGFFVFLETEYVLVRMLVVYQRLDDVDCIGNCIGSVI